MTMTNGTNGTKPVFDFDAARAAARAEANHETFAFSFGGKTYEVLALTDWPATGQAKLSEGNVGGAAEELIVGGAGPLFDAGVTTGDLVVLFEEVARWTGTGGLPNSSPPVPAGTTLT